VDNEAELEEQDIIDILTEQGQEADNELDEDYVATNELPETVEGLTELLLKEREIKSKRNISLRKSKDANHRMQEEITALTAKVEESLKNPNQAPDVVAQRRLQDEEDEKTRNSVNDDPGLMVDLMNNKVGSMQDNVVNVLTSMKASFDEQIAELKGEVSPEKIKYRDKVNALKANPGFAGIDDSALFALVQAVDGKKAPRGPIGGRRANITADPDKALAELRERARKQHAGNIH